MHWGKDSLFIQGGSLYWLDKKSKTLGKVGQTHNLPSLASRLAVRSGDDLMLALSEGVVRWSPRTGKTVLYTRRDGLPDNFAEVPNVACRLSDGRIAIGMSYSASVLIRRMRVEKAKELLERSTLNISEVSYSVGFSDPGYFSKVFKAETGVPPNDWGRS